MATPIFVVGYDKAVASKLGANGSYTTLNITAWSWEPTVNTLLVTHTASGGIAARIAGVLDGEGTVEANYDSANNNFATAPGIIPGARGLIQVQVGASTPFTIPVIIQKVPFKSSVDGLVQYSFTVQMDQQSGTYLQPT